MTSSRMMQALVVAALSDDYAGTGITDVPVPVAGPADAVVRIHAAAVNFPDLLMTRGAYQLKPDLPFTLGMEFSGEVVAVGEGADQAMIGSAVVGGNRHGAMAGYACVPAAGLRPKPDRLSWDAAAAYGAAYLTAYVALVRRAQVLPGEWVLVHGASGGVGLACVDLAKQLGARVIAAGSAPDKLARVADLYHPEATIDVRAGFRERVKAITGGAGADVIFDPVGGDIFDESTRCIAFDGRLLVIGFTSGRIPVVSVNMPLIKGFSVVGVRAGEYGRRFPARGAENVAAVDAMAATGQIRPHVHAAMSLANWRDGFDMLSNRSVVGKVVLRP